MASKPKGVTIAIKADTSGATAGLGELTDESIKLSKQLKSVDALMKMDGGNHEVAAQRQEILTKSIANTEERLKALRNVQEDVKRKFENNEINREQYIAFQRELVTTEQRLRDLTAAEQETETESVQANESAGKFGETLKNIVAKGAELAASAVSSAAKSVAGMVSDLSLAGDKIDKTSQKLGMSAQAYQEWDFIMQHSGSDINSMTTSMKKLAEAVVDQSETSVAAFEKIGISMEDAAKMSQEDLFAATIKGLQGMGNGAERTATAVDLLGKQAMDLAPLLNTSAEDTEAMRQQVHELGGVLSDDAVKASAAYQDSLLNMNTAIQGVKNKVGSAFMPAVTEMMEGIANLVSGDESAAESVSAGAEHLIQRIGAFIPTIAEMAAKLVESFAGAIVKELPQLIRTAMKLTVKFVKGIVDAAPKIIPAAVELVGELVETLTRPDLLSKLVGAAIELTVALTDGLIQSLPELLEYLPQIVQNIVDVIVENAPKLLEAAEKIVTALATYLFDSQNVDTMLTAAMDIITTLVKGLMSVIWKIGEAAGKIVEKIAEKIGLGDYWKMGADIIDQFMGGIMDAWNRWQSWWEGFGEYIYDALHPGGDTQTDWENYIGNAAGGTVGNTRALIGPENMTGNGSGGISNTTANNTTTINFGDIVVNGGDKNAANDFIRQVDRQLRDLQTRQNRGIGGVSWATS